MLRIPMGALGVKKRPKKLTFGMTRKTWIEKDVLLFQSISFFWWEFNVSSAYIILETSLKWVGNSNYSNQKQSEKHLDFRESFGVEGRRMLPIPKHQLVLEWYVSGVISCVFITAPTNPTLSRNREVEKQE